MANLKCKLCDKEKELIKKSHIVSKLLFRDLFEHQQRRGIVEINISIPNKPKNLPDVLYDKGLFCSECDGDEGMGTLEDYYKKYIVKNEFEVEKRTEIDWHIYSKYDFDKLYSFFNIQLFRAALSTRKDFSQVILDDSIIEKIRVNIDKKRIISNTNEIVILKLSHESDFKDMIGSFTKIGNNYMIILRNFIVFYFFDVKDSLYSKLKGHRLTENEIIMPVIPKNIEKEFIKSIIGIQ